MPKRSLSLLTYNIHKGFSLGNIRFLLPEMRLAIESLSPDLAFLQEVQGEHSRQEKRIYTWPDCAQFEYIAEHLWPHYIYGKNAIYQAGHHGNAILSKHPFSEYENINVSNMVRASRSLLHATVEVEDKTIHLVCVHLGLFKAERLEQLEKLASRVNEYIPSDAPLVLAGDFNDWRRECSDIVEEKLGLKEAIKETTGYFAKSFPAIRPVLHTDRIYFRGMELIEASCLTGKPWRLLSDHLPLHARFQLIK